jgi:predicted anti-sigma-YlaC factor YlaD
MMIRGDQHVDDWAEVAVDYLDGRLDHETRLAVENHLAGCPDCAARLRKQQSVVRFLQESALYDPPEDLEYRAIGEMIFPSPGGRPIAPPVEVEKPSRSPRWYRTLRAWMPATVAVIALLAAVIGYGIVRSGSGAEVATNTDRAAGGITTVAEGATTAAPSASEATVSGAAATMTTAAAATTTTALATGPPATEPAPATFVATQDRKAMISALATTQAPAYVSFRAPVDTLTTSGQSTTTSVTGATETTATQGTDTTAGAAPAATAPSATETTAAAGAGNVTLVTVSQDQVNSIVQQIIGFTGMRPLDQSLWLDGPTYAAFLPRKDADKLVDLVRSIGASLGLVVRLEGDPPAAAKSTSERLLEHKELFPVLAAHRALQPATWGYDFTTSTLASADGAQPGTTTVTPDEAGTHVIVVIWIAE